MAGHDIAAQLVETIKAVQQIMTLAEPDDADTIYSPTEELLEQLNNVKALLGQN